MFHNKLELTLKQTSLKQSKIMHRFKSLKECKQAQSTFFR